MKILVFMSDNRKLDTSMETADYPSFAASINSHYCKQHGYDFVYFHPYLYKKYGPKHKTMKTISLEQKGVVQDKYLYNCFDPITKEPRHAAWSKLLSTQRALQLPYDYVVYIDSDCIFKKNQSIEEFIRPYSKEILFLNDKPYHYDKPCSGFYILKNTPATKKFVKDWYHVQLPEKNKEHAWEQSALLTIFEKYDVQLIDDWMFKEKRGQFLRHIGSFDAQGRIPYFKAFMKKHKIPFATDIKVIPFSTKSKTKKLI